MIVSFLDNESLSHVAKVILWQVFFLFSELAFSRLETLSPIHMIHKVPKALSFVAAVLGIALIAGVGYKATLKGDVYNMGGTTMSVPSQAPPGTAAQLSNSSVAATTNGAYAVISSVGSDGDTISGSEDDNLYDEHGNVITLNVNDEVEDTGDKGGADASSPYGAGVGGSCPVKFQSFKYPTKSTVLNVPDEYKDRVGVFPNPGTYPSEQARIVHTQAKVTNEIAKRLATSFCTTTSVHLKQCPSTCTPGQPIVSPPQVTVAYHHSILVNGKSKDYYTVTSAFCSVTRPCN